MLGNEHAPLRRLTAFSDFIYFADITSRLNNVRKSVLLIRSISKHLQVFKQK